MGMACLPLREFHQGELIWEKSLSPARQYRYQRTLIRLLVPPPRTVLVDDLRRLKWIAFSSFFGVEETVPVLEHSNEFTVDVSIPVVLAKQGALGPESSWRRHDQVALRRESSGHQKGSTATSKKYNWRDTGKLSPLCLVHCQHIGICACFSLLNAREVPLALVASSILIRALNQGQWK